MYVLKAFEAAPTMVGLATTRLQRIGSPQSLQYVCSVAVGTQLNTRTARRQAATHLRWTSQIRDEVGLTLSNRAESSASKPPAKW